MPWNLIWKSETYYGSSSDSTPITGTVWSTSIHRCCIEIFYMTDCLAVWHLFYTEANVSNEMPSPRLSGGSRASSLPLALAGCRHSRPLLALPSIVSYRLIPCEGRALWGPSPRETADRLAPVINAWIWLIELALVCIISIWRNLMSDPSPISSKFTSWKPLPV